MRGDGRKGLEGKHSLPKKLQRPDGRIFRHAGQNPSGQIAETLAGYGFGIQSHHWFLHKNRFGNIGVIRDRAKIRY